MKVKGVVRARVYTRDPGQVRTEILVILRVAGGAVRFARVTAPKRWRSPSPRTILKARKAAGLTQKAAAEKCFSARRSWQDWERGKRRMHPALWQVFYTNRFQN